MPPKMFRACPSLPIVEVLRSELHETEHRKIESLAARLRAEEPALAATGAFGPQVVPGLLDAPALLFEDYSGLALFRGFGQGYRSLALAGAGDTVVIEVARDPAFEVYCRDHLGLGGVHVHRLAAAAPAPATSLAKRAMGDPALIERLVSVARAHKGLNVIPYMGTGGTWALAAKIAASSGCDVRVAAPPPRLVQRVNDKFWVACRFKELLGRDALPVTYPAYGPAAIAGLVRALAARHPRVFVKVPDSAGSAGNLVFERAAVLDLSAAELRAHLLSLLAERGWKAGYPLIVGIWDGPVLESPSVQLWVPHEQDGMPIVEGVFSQIVSGAVAAFAGAAPSVLPERLQLRLAHEASLLARLFQRLGYFGRCSFDAVLAGDDLDHADIHWVECNGRWGGVSVPLTLANRLTGDWRRRPPYIVSVIGGEDEPSAAISTVLDRLKDRLFHPPARDQGIVVFAPVRTAKGVGAQLMALADTIASGRRMAAEAIALLRG